MRTDQTLLFNGDDPALAAITENVPARRRAFGLQESRYTLDELPHAADSAVCRRCGASLRYDQLFLSHLGHYRCDNCGFERPDIDYGATSVELTRTRLYLVRPRIRRETRTPECPDSGSLQRL